MLRKIGLLQRNARLWAWACGYTAALLLFVALVFAGVLLDHALSLRETWRAVFFGVLVISSTLFLLAATLLPAVRQLTPLYIAGRIEKATPKLENSLISYVQCRRDARVSAALKHLMLEKAEAHVRPVDPYLVSPVKLSSRLTFAFVSLMLLFGLYAVLSPKSTTASVARLLSPRADILPPTRTRIVDVNPGDLYVLKGTQPTVMVRIEGYTEQTPYALWSGATFSDKRLFLSGGARSIWTCEFPPVLEDGSYEIVAGDSRSRSYTVRALPGPAVSQITAELTPPTYTGRPSTLVEGGDIEAVYGTAVVLHALTTLPPRSGSMELSSGRRIWLEPKPEADGLLGRFRLTESTTYRILFESKEYPGGVSFRNSSPVSYRLTCEQDGTPSVRILSPADGAQVPAGEGVAIEFTASDDCALTEVRINSTVSGIQRTEVVATVEQPTSSVRGKYEWDLAGLRIKEGSVLTYSIEADDNWPDGPQTGRSETRSIIIGELPQLMEPEAVLEVADADVPSEPPERQGTERADQLRETPPPEPEAEEAQGSSTRIAQNITRLLDEMRRREQAGQPPGQKGEQAASRTRGPAPTGQTPSREPPGPRPGVTAPEREGGEKPSQTGERPRTAEADRTQPAAEPAEMAGEGGEEPCSSCPTGPAPSAEGPGAAAAGDTASGAGESGEQAGAEAAGATASGAEARRAAASAAGESGQAAEAGAGRRGDVSTEAAAVPAGAAGRQPGGGEATLPSQGPGTISRAAADAAVDELEALLADDALPPKTLKDLGISKEKLQELLERYQALRQQEESSGRARVSEPGLAGQRPEAGVVLETTGAASEEVLFREVQPEDREEDDLRTAFEGVSSRISARYRELVESYHKKLSEER